MVSSTGADAAFGRGFALHQKGQLAEAGECYQEALKSDPLHFHALHLLGVVAAQMNQPERAVGLIGQAIQIEPRSALAHNNRGNALLALGRLEAALESFEHALSIEPNHVDARFNRGILRNTLKQHAAAIEDFERLIALVPGHAGAYAARANVLRELGRYYAALESIDAAIEIAPDYADAHNIRGIVLAETGRYEPAERSFERAIVLRPDYADAYNNRGNALRYLQRYDSAIASLARAIELRSSHVDAHYNLGLVFSESDRYEDALTAYDSVIALAPNHLGAHQNRALALRALSKLEAADAALETALALSSDFAPAHHSRGLVLFDLGRFEAAVASYDRALALQPDYTEAHFSRANALLELRRYEAAADGYERVLALDADYKFARGLLVQARVQICCWTGLQERIADLNTRITRGEPACVPFAVMALTDSAATQQRAARIWVRDQHAASDALGPIPRFNGHSRIRLGYFSPDFREHAVSMLMAELFDLQDRGRFELTAFSLGPDTQDPLQRRLRRSFERFIDAGRMTDREIAQLARSLELDIAVDLAGFTAGSRPGIFALRAAPLQVSYLGYSGTMAADYMDYLIADRTVVPPQSRHHYGEKIIHLPHSYLVNDSRREIAERLFSRRELGLPETGFVYCCFNNTYKISPATFDSWMRILRRVDGSVLWLSSAEPVTMSNLRREAQQRGVSAERLIFSQRMPDPAEHLARHRAADLFLDTLPYNAHATSSDALWAGLPVLTCLGEAFAARVAASLLRAIGLPELITSRPEEYEALACELAANRQKLTAIRNRLAAQRLTSPLYDTRLFTHHLEAAYARIHTRHEAGLLPEDLWIDPATPAH
jgi:protein O-GlcNAc transferase